MVNRIIVPMVETARDRSFAMGLSSPDEWERGIRELSHSGDLPGGTFFYTWFKALARSPG